MARAHVLTDFTTANLRNSMTEHEVLDALYPLLAKSDVLVLQEMNGRNAQALLDRLAPGEWWATQVTHTNVPGLNDGAVQRVVVAYRRKRFSGTISGWFVLHLSRLFPSADRTFTWTTVRDRRTGRKWNLGAVHLVPHADDPKDPGDIIETPRGALVDQAIGRILDWVAKCTGQVALGGDWNIDLKADLIHRDQDGLADRMHRAGLVTPPAVLNLPIVPTHGRERYDQWWFRLDHRAGRIIGERVHAKRGSDHAAVTATVLQSVRRGWRG